MKTKRRRARRGGGGGGFKSDEAKIRAKGESLDKDKTDSTTTNKQDPQDTPAGRRIQEKSGTPHFFLQHLTPPCLPSSVLLYKFCFRESTSHVAKLYSQLKLNFKSHFLLVCWLNFISSPIFRYFPIFFFRATSSCFGPQSTYGFQVQRQKVRAEAAEKERDLHAEAADGCEWSNRKGDWTMVLLW